MRSLGIIGLYRLRNHLTQFGHIGAPVNQKFLLEYAIHPFSQRILIAVIALGHRRSNLVFLQQVLVDL